MDMYQVLLATILSVFLTHGAADPISATTESGSQPKKEFISELRVRVAMTTQGTLEAEVTWDQSLSFAAVHYIISWGRHSCNVEPGMPHCPLKEKTMPTARLSAKPGKHMRILLVGLTFNSKYSVRVRMVETGAIKGATFFTDLCQKVDSTFMRCGQEEEEKKTKSTSNTYSSHFIERDDRLTLDVDEKNTGLFSKHTRFLLVIALTLSVGAIFIVIVLFYLYRRCVELDQASFTNHINRRGSNLPLYTDLPLLDVPIYGRRPSDLNQLQMPLSVAQRMLPGSQHSEAIYV